MSDTRINVLAEIARLYPDLIDPANSRGADRSGGDSIGLMPLTYTPTVREYERLVKRMRDDRTEPLIELNGEKVSVRCLWWHLEHFHHRAQRVIRHHPVTTKQGGRQVALVEADGKTPVTRPSLGYLRDPKADEARAERAIQWVADSWDWRRVGEPMLPREVVEGFKAAA